MTTPQGVIPLTQAIAHPPLVRFDKYILVRKLAEGGMAEIFLAKQVGAEGFERDVVLKLMLGHLSSSREFVEMFLDEARLAAKLHHPNIVQISDLGHFNGRYFICMEYLPGEDLQSMVEVAARTNKPVPFAVAARIIHSACEGLEFAHAYGEHGVPLGVVHRDVSPSNIIVTYQGLVKVLDFGIAKAGSKLTQTQPGLLKGKWGYMSPEQARGDGALDGRSDLFSLGITFHELLTGQRVFRKDNEISVLLALMQQPIPPPSAIRRDIPHALDRIVMKALEKQPEDRYPDAGAFRADLEAYLATTSSPGMSTLAAYMVSLFGREQMAERTQIPSLRELSAFMGTPQDATSSQPMDRAGTDPTWVRKATPAHPQPAPPLLLGQETLTPFGKQIHAPDVQPDAATIQLEIPPHELLAQRKALEARGSGGSGWRWAFATLLLAVVAGGGYGYLRMHPERLDALLGHQPQPPPLPPSAPIEVVTPTPTPPPTPPPVEPAPTPPPVETLSPVPPRREKPVLLTTKELGPLLARVRPQVQSCFEHNRPKAGSKLEVELAIANSGGVKSARIVTAGLEAGPLAGCISRTLKAVHFPRNTNNPPVTIIVPYSYGPGP